MPSKQTNTNTRQTLDKIDKLEDNITDKLNRNTKDDDLSELERKISSFKPHFKNLGSNNNNVVEFLTKIMFDKNSNAQLHYNNVDKNKTIQDLLSKEQWDKVFGIERERLNRYGEYELIYSYIPELSACIDSFRDAIISPDSLTDDSIPISLPEYAVSKEASVLFENNMKFLEKKYKLRALQKQVIGDTLKLGDQFKAVLRYEDEFQKLLLKENDKVMLPPEFLDPSLAHTTKPEVLNESFYTQPIFDELRETILNESTNDKNQNMNDYYDKVVGDVKHLLNSVKVKNSKEYAQENKSIGAHSSRIDFSKLELKGCMIKDLNPKYTVKLEIDGINLGYLYAEKQKNKGATERDTLMKDFFSSRTNITQDVNGKTKEELLFNIVSKGIAKKVDLDFIEDNKEYKDLIYLLLKNEELIRGEVEFVYFSPDEVIHFAVDKEGVYGTSRLAKSLFFAKLYIPSILNEFMQKLTRGRDKRVVYVDVGVDEAVEESIQEVVRDIKSKEIQTDSLQSLTTILKTVGNFEDYYIPQWDGEQSITFDTIQGMDVQSDRDWNEFLLKSVIKGTGFPANYIDSSNDVDFARTVIMQNQLLVRKVVSDQESLSEPMTELIRKVYQYEYETINKDQMDNNKDDKVTLETEVSNATNNISNMEDQLEEHNINEEIINNLEVIYNPPVALNLNNVNDQISSATQTLDFVMSSYFDDQEDSDEIKIKKLKFKRKAVEVLVPSIDFDKFDELFEAAGIETKEEILLQKTLKKNDDDDYDEFGDYGGGDDFGGGGGGNPSGGGGTMDFTSPDQGGGQDFANPDQGGADNQDFTNPDQGAAAPQGDQGMNGVEDLQNNGMGI